MIEFYIAVAVCLAVSLAVRAYLRWFHASSSGDPAFEAWCRQHPVVVALHCTERGEDEVYDALRHALAGQTDFVNRHGGWPWQHYVLDIDYRRVAPGVVGLLLTGCRLKRGDRSAARELDSVSAALGGVAPLVDEVWLHGQLHKGGYPSKYDRARMGWVGSLEEDGRLVLTPAIGSPEWLGERARLTRR